MQGHKRVLSLTQHIKSNTSIPLDKQFEWYDRLLSSFLKSYFNRQLDHAYFYAVTYVYSILIDLPCHGYYSSFKYEYDRKRVQVLVFMMADLLLHSVAPSAAARKVFNRSDLLRNTSIQKHRQKTSHYRRISRSSTLSAGSDSLDEMLHSNTPVEDAKYLFDLSRTNSGGSVPLLLDCFEKNGDKTKIEKKSSKSSRNSSLGTEVTLEQHFQMIRDRILTESERIKIQCDPIYQSLEAALIAQGYDQYEKSGSGVVHNHPFYSGVTPNTPSKESKKGMERLITASDYLQPGEDVIIYSSDNDTLSKAAEWQDPFAEVNSPDTPSSHSKNTLPEVTRQEPSEIIPIKKLTQFFEEDFNDLRRNGIISVIPLDTYQGKKIDPETGLNSCNGCTVIAALIGIKYLALNNVPGIPDDMIEDVIDKTSPLVLREIRTNLGLLDNALIIPSDVHDYLINHNMIRGEQLADICGGNIMDEKHLQVLIKNITDNGNKVMGKVAATLFFREHVICILKVVFPSNGVCWYDLVDSYPSFDPTFSNHEVETADACRIRCKSIPALEATLRWYSCQRFSEEDCAYIDSYKWDELRCDLDPRVYQSFIWRE